MEPNLKLSFSKLGPSNLNVLDEGLSSTTAYIDDLVKSLSARDINIPGLNALQDLLMQAGKYVGLPIDQQIANVVKSRAPQIATIVKQVQKDPALFFILSLLLANPHTATLTTDKYKLALHALALSMSETGGTYDPESYYSGTNTYQGKLLPAHAYGLFQQTPAAWDYCIKYFNASDMGKSYVKSGTMTYIAKYIGTTPEELLHPFHDYGPSYASYLQIVPALGQLLFMDKFIGKTFNFDPAEGWILKEHIHPSQRWNEIVEIYSPQLKDFDLGYQVIMTLTAANGSGFLRLAKPLSYMERPRLDMQHYVALAGSEEVKSLLMAMPKMLSSILPASVFKLIYEQTSPELSEGGDPKLPTTGYTVTSKFGNRVRNGKVEFHNGVDLRADMKTPLYAPKAGIVNTSYKDKADGNRITIKTKHGYIYGMSHLDSRSVTKTGAAVSQGALLGYSGNTGMSDAPHLHLTLRNKNYVFVDPTTGYLDLNLIFKPKT